METHVSVLMITLNKQFVDTRFKEKPKNVLHSILGSLIRMVLLLEAHSHLEVEMLDYFKDTVL